MKKFVFPVLLLSVFLLASPKAQAQFEIKTNPLGLIFGSIPLSAEYVLKPNIGLELTGSYTKVSLGSIDWSGTKATFQFKYYFSPDKGGDKFYAFPYLRYVNRSGEDTYDNEPVTVTNNVFGGGFGLGYKWVAESGLLFDLGFGIGRNLTNTWEASSPDYQEAANLDFPGINFVGRASVGYRF